MKSSVKNFLLTVFGIGMIGILIATMFFWETRGRETFLYEEIIVFNREVQRGEAIEGEMLTYMNIQQDQVTNAHIQDPSQIIGLVPKHFVPGNYPLHEMFFQEDTFSLKEDEYIATIPNDWIHVMPHTIRRGDEIVLYAIDQSRIDDDGENGSIRRSINRGGDYTELTVAYAKDGSNKEIIDVSREFRMDGSSRIAELQVITNRETMEYLNKLSHTHQFIVMYKNYITEELLEEAQVEEEEEGN